MRVSRTPGSGRMANRRSTSTWAWPAPSRTRSVAIGARGCIRPSVARLRRVGGAARIVGMTWSILVRDPATGALGAAVATRFFAVGALAIHVEGGVAALATQALINPMYAVHGMARLRAGEPPEAVAAALLAEDAAIAREGIPPT